MKYSVWMLPLTLLSVNACSQQQLKADPIETEQAMQSTSKEISGTLIYKNLEGGFFGFDSDKGNKYTLRNLPPEFKKNGIKLQVNGRVRNDIMTFTQYGDVFEVESVKVLDESGIKPKNNEL
ncbi:hypothetical protein HHX48_04385 [Salinimonas sp. HHU 13199]|uniref:Bacterial OB-fold domain-containing protein n=1 Tax=Salinimonas profundi TaxID=2729140 RepID=A0ABR8LLM5_9ALTE|nr:hypothetical protein [Salinimonas profundi]MBD3584974.1 hypothetical protein [Salinimonas profundi]